MTRQKVILAIPDRTRLGDDPLENGLNRDQARVRRFAHDREKLKPKIIISSLGEFANGPGYELWQWYRRKLGMLHQPHSYVVVERRQNISDNVRAIEPRNEFAKHKLPISYN